MLSAEALPQRIDTFPPNGIFWPPRWERAILNPPFGRCPPANTPPQHHMPFLRDPLLLTLLASSLAHGLVLTVSARSTVVPAADVQAGRTSVRLRPSPAIPPAPALSERLAAVLPTAAVRPTRTPRTPSPETSSAISPDREPPPVIPRHRTPTSELGTPSPHVVVPVPSSFAGPSRSRPASPPPNPQFTAVFPRRSNPRSDPRQPQRLARPVAVDRSDRVPPRLPTPSPTEHRPTVPAITPSGAPPSLTFAARTVDSPAPAAPLARRPAAPPSTLPQPASEDSRGGPRRLPVALPDNPLPRYPRRAAREKRRGTVVLALRVNRSGQVTSATVKKSSGHADLDEAALVAARTWRFLPARRGGKAVEITVLKPFRFIGRRR